MDTKNDNYARMDVSTYSDNKQIVLRGKSGIYKRVILEILIHFTLK